MQLAGHRLSSIGKVGVALALTTIAFGSRGVDSASSSNGSGGTPVGAREVIGCTSGGTDDVAHGPRGRRIVALTFDDGPSLSFSRRASSRSSIAFMQGEPFSRRGATSPTGKR